MTLFLSVLNCFVSLIGNLFRKLNTYNVSMCIEGFSLSYKKRLLFWIRQKPVEFLNGAVIGLEIIMCRAVQFSAGTWNLFYTTAIWMSQQRRVNVSGRQRPKYEYKVQLQKSTISISGSYIWERDESSPWTGIWKDRNWDCPDRLVINRLSQGFYCNDTLQCNVM